MDAKKALTCLSAASDAGKTKKTNKGTRIDGSQLFLML